VSPESADNPPAAETTGEQPQNEAAATGGSAASASMPPADFGTLVQMFSMQAMVALGAIPHPAAGKPEVQLPLARHFIDLLGVVESKSKGNLTREEASLLDGSLHSLRMMYLEISKKSGS
jgi:hypothetical protein